MFLRKESIFALLLQDSKGRQAISCYDFILAIRVDDIPILMRFDDTETAALLYAWYQTDAFYREFAIPNFCRHTAQYPGRSFIVEGTTITLPVPEEYFAELNPFHKKVLKFFFLLF